LAKATEKAMARVTAMLVVVLLSAPNYGKTNLAIKRHKTHKTI
jgi:hypothetical protein